jgi:hypothetical protein
VYFDSYSSSSFTLSVDNSDIFYDIFLMINAINSSKISLNLILDLYLKLTSLLL